MRINTQQKSVIAYRRELVASLRLRKYSLRRIAAELARQGCVNPDTGQPWTEVTIYKDVHALEREWRKAAAADIAKHQARQLAELEEVKALAWQQEKPDIVIQAIKQECAILGTQAPAKSELTVTNGDEIGERILGRLAGIAARAETAAASGGDRTGSG